jgi:hypothetical protein
MHPMVARGPPRPLHLPFRRVEQPASREMIGSRIAFRMHDAATADYVGRLFAAFPETHGADRECVIEPAESEGFALLVDGSLTSSSDSPEALIPTLVQFLNRTVATDTPHVLVHAGCVERNGAAVVLPAAMEHGKTTLTTGLVRAGFGYVTDEAVAIRRDTQTIVPYPKPLSIDPGSWSLFPELEPDEPFATDAYKASQWQVPPTAIRPDALGAESRARFIVFPVYDADATTELIPLARAEALIELAKNTFRFDQEGRPTLDVLATVVAQSDAYRLPNSSLDEAVACVSALFD